jgi:predicted dinucleotide-binding enzyme
MATAVIGTGNIGEPLARHLAHGGESVMVASRDADKARQVADDLGGNARAATVDEAIAGSDTVVFAVWFDVVKSLIEEHADDLVGKVVVDPSNPIAPNDSGGFDRTLPDGTSAGSVIAQLLPDGAHFVKAFGTLPADALANGSNRSPRKAALFYATDDEVAERTVERLIESAGFDPVGAGGVDDALRIEVFGDLHPSGGLDGRIPDAEEARAARDAA